jgi:hypothetical protein
MNPIRHVRRLAAALAGLSSASLAFAAAAPAAAEHSFRVAIVGMTLAGLEGADVGRTTALCLVHDAHETRIGDVPSVGRAYMTTAAPEAITAHQTGSMPDHLAKLFQDLTAEYEAGQTIESKVAHDADKIETLLQAAEYQAQGYDTGPGGKRRSTRCGPRQPSSWRKRSTQPSRVPGGPPSPRTTTSCAPARKAGHGSSWPGTANRLRRPRPTSSATQVRALPKLAVIVIKSCAAARQGAADHPGEFGMAGDPAYRRSPRLTLSSSLPLPQWRPTGVANAIGCADH